MTRQHDRSKNQKKGEPSKPNSTDDKNSPMEARFEPKHSGNAKNQQQKRPIYFESLIRELLEAPIPACFGAKMQGMSWLEALMHRQIDRGMAGNRKAIESVVRLAIELQAISLPKPYEGPTDLNRLSDEELKELARLVDKIRVRPLPKEEQELANAKKIFGAELFES